jgi:hypothetical protein
MANIGDIPEKQSTSVNKPESGTYGERVDLERLRAAVPGGGSPVPAPEARPLPPISERPVRSLGKVGSVVPGLPSALLRPTARPQEPVTTMPTQAPQQLSMSGMQMRLRKLDILANHPDVSPETRDWARMMIRVLTSGGE